MTRSQNESRAHQPAAPASPSALLLGLRRGLLPAALIVDLAMVMGGCAPAEPPVTAPGMPPTPVMTEPPPQLPVATPGR